LSYSGAIYAEGNGGSKELGGGTKLSTRGGKGEKKGVESLYRPTFPNWGDNAPGRDCVRDGRGVQRGKENREK